VNPSQNSTFLYFLCQPGFEKALKLEIARALPELKFSFSQPGFLTFRAADVATTELPSLLYGQDAGRVIGKPERTSWEELIARLDSPAQLLLLCPKPGEDDEYFPKLRAVGEKLRARLPKTKLFLAGDRVDHAFASAPTALILHSIDGNWTEEFGWNLGKPLLSYTQRVSTKRFPLGGIWPLEPDHYPARSYLKTQEAVERYDLPLKSGQTALEIGSAPGGSVLWLLEQGLNVIGVDAGKMTEKVSAHPRYRHLSSSFFDLGPQDLVKKGAAPIDWVLIDIHAPPAVTIKALRRCKDHLLEHGIFEKLQGALITFKLNRPDAFQDVADYQKSVFNALEKPEHVWVKQLSSNRKEISIVALRGDLSGHGQKAKSPNRLKRNPTS